MKEYELTVEGMSCSGCEERVQDAVSQVDGVHRVTADRETNTIEITADDGTEDAVRDAIYTAGYVLSG